MPRIRSSTQRTFWPVTIVWKPSPPISPIDLRRPCATPSGPTKWHGPRPGNVRLDEAASAPRAVGFTTTVAPRGRVDVRGERAHRVAREAVADLARLVVAHEHLVDDLVAAARARRVVRAVQDELAPRDVGERVRVLLGR